MITCGKCKAKHETVAQVKACYAAVPTKFAVELDLKTPEFVAAIQAKEAAEDAVAYASKSTAVAVLDRPEPATLPGMYAKNGQVFRVKLSKSGYLYAQLVTMFDGKPTYTYAPRVFKSLTVNDKMTIEAAEAYSLKINHCCCCGKMLTNTKSVTLGIGPVCRKKYF